MRRESLNFIWMRAAKYARVSWFGLRGCWPASGWVSHRSNRRPTFAIGRPPHLDQNDQSARVRCERMLSGLGRGAPPVDPPAYIRDRLAARLEQERQVSPAPLRGPVEQKSVSPTATHEFPWSIVQSCV